MKSFNEIYQEVYVNSGNELKNLKQANTQRNIFFVIIIVMLGIFTFYFRSIFIGIISIVVLIIMLIAYAKEFKNYKLQYKEKVIKEFIHGYSDGLDYRPQEGIASSQYSHAGFDGYYDRYYSEDLIKGEILENCKISMAEVHTQREETTTDSNGNTTTTYVTLFHGLFAKIDLNCFNSVDFMVEKNKIFKGIFGKKYRLEMDSNEFEKIYDVKTSDKISTLRILTSDIMQLLIDFKKQNKVVPEISLRGNNLYIRYGVGNVFEPNLLKNDMDFDKLKKTYNMINFTLNLAKEFTKNIIEFEK